MIAVLGRPSRLRILSPLCAIITALSGIYLPSDAQAVPLIGSVGQQINSNFVYPVMGPRTSSSFGARWHPVKKKVKRHHHGVDLAAPKGSIIRAIADGQIIYSDPLGGYGNLIVIKHANGLTSHYGHCDKTRVSVGRAVRAGDIIGTVGSSGLSTGPHLHFEIRQDGQPKHPEQVLPGLDLPAAG